MASKKALPLSYVKFLNLVAAARQLPGLPEIDAVEDQILGFLARSWYAGQRVTVLEAMNSLPDISPSTVQRRLKTLRAKGMLQMQADEYDSRFKYIESTDLATRYFAALGQCIHKAQAAR
ncbi:MarR family transcriptional regulator [Ramlibacter sp. MAHUQ-53]|uniref:MarR family transcriptional regulator n=1 Tax=unclassified Ramlibacter TaxID=2617605 RepID=UPI00363A0D24